MSSASHSKTTPKVSVIVPVYKAEAYIEQSTCTLFDQTLESIEFIFIDDHSPDNSLKILNRIICEYPRRQGQIKIISHKENQGVGKSRQDGINMANGEYIIHCDPDDWLESDTYEKLYNKAKETNADVVIGSYYEEFGSWSRLRIPEIYESKKEMFSNIANGKFHMGLWNKLVTSKLAKSFSIPTGVNLCEDMSIMIPILLSSNMIVIEEKATYHYRQTNPTSITNNPSDENILSKIEAIKYITEFINNDTPLQNIDYKDLMLLQWKAKREFLNNITKDRCNKWLSIFPESSVRYNSLKIPLKSKILSFLALNKMVNIIKFLSIIYYKNPIFK